jgi:hypothetical protein
MKTDRAHTKLIVKRLSLWGLFAVVVIAGSLLVGDVGSTSNAPVLAHVVHVAAKAAGRAAVVSLFGVLVLLAVYSIDMRRK